MFINGIKMLEENLPDLLDQSAGAAIRQELADAEVSIQASPL